MQICQCGELGTAGRAALQRSTTPPLVTGKECATGPPRLPFPSAPPSSTAHPTPERGCHRPLTPALNVEGHIHPPPPSTTQRLPHPAPLNASHTHPLTPYTIPPLPSLAPNDSTPSLPITTLLSSPPQAWEEVSLTPPAPSTSLTPPTPPPSAAPSLNGPCSPLPLPSPMSTTVFSASNIFSSASLLHPSSSPLPLSSTTTLQDFDYDEALEDDRLGEGRYGVVFRAVRKADGLTVALKRLRVRSSSSAHLAQCTPPPPYRSPPCPVLQHNLTPTSPSSSLLSSSLPPLCVRSDLRHGREESRALSA